MKRLVVLVVVAVWFNYSYGQSRGIIYKYNLVDSVFPPNWESNESTTFEIANENVIVYTPSIQRGGSYYSVLSRFNSNLCYLGSKKVLENQSNLLYTGISKNDGGFATYSYTKPYVIRNYDSQGNLIFSKKLIDSNTYSAMGSPQYPRMVANPDTNNLYFAYREYSNEVNDSIQNFYGSPLINIAEISSTGSVVNSFQFKIPYDAIYSFNGSDVCHTWVYGTDISSLKYVKGSFGPASDRIWISLNLTARGSYEVDSNQQITSNQMNGAFPLVHYNVILIANPYPGSSGGDATILIDHPACRDATLVQSKDAQGFNNAQMMLLTVESQVPHIYKFNDHNYSTPNNKYKFPFSVTTGGFLSEVGDLKNHQNTILFSVERYFGIFNPTTLEVNLRQQDPGNFNAYGVVNFNKRNTNSLYLNYNDGNGFPANVSNFLIKEDINYFKLTCKSSPVFIQNAVAKPFTYFKLTGYSFPYSGISMVPEPYTELVDNGIISSQDVCLRCYGRLSSDTSSDPENTEIVLQPNPTKNYFELTTEVTIEKVEVYSMLGQLVKTFEKQDQYSIVGIHKGSYIVKITTTNGEVLDKTLLIE